MKVVVIGGGPAGMMASIAAAQSGDEVVLLEKNEKLGKRLFITGFSGWRILRDINASTCYSI